MFKQDLRHERIVKISKMLLTFFLAIYSAPIFFYNDQVDFSLLIYFISVYFVTVFYFIFSRNNDFSKLKIQESDLNIKVSCLLLFFLYGIIITQTKDNFIGLFNRNTRESEFIQGNLYVVIDIIIRVIFCKLIIKGFTSNKSSFHKVLIFLLIIFSFFFDIGYLGARRTSLFIFMVLLWVFLPRITLKKFIFFIVVMMLIGIVNFLFSGYRELIYAGYTEFGLTETIAASLFSNEFQLVSDNFLRYQKYAHSTGFGFGETIINTPLTFIPRFLWSSKPQSIDKISGIFPNMIGELYYNFGYFLLFPLQIYFFLILNFIKKNKKYSVFIFALIPELFRTTISTFILSIFLYVFFDKIFSIKLKLSKND